MRTAQPQRRNIPDAVNRALRAMETQRREHVEKFGHAREPVHVDFHGHKFVAVGGTLHWSSRWRNFTDFLLDYIKKVLVPVFGKDWYSTERSKAPEMRHPIVRWFESFCELGSGATRKADGFFEATADGQTLAYLNLAYDLFVIADNARLQGEVVRRLRDRVHFQGARYELAVAAIMVRAGFTLDFEDESDHTHRHPEFVATHTESGAQVAVEAKARRRSGVMGWIGPRQPASEIRLSIDDLLRDACTKTTDRPLVVFIDANMPPEMANDHLARWTTELHETLPRVAHGFGDTGVFEGVPFSLLVITNTPHDYAARGEMAASPGVYMTEPSPARRPLPNSAIAPSIAKALRQYGQIPEAFPADPRE